MEIIMKINFSKRDWIIIGSVLLTIIVLVVSIILIDNAIEGNKIDKIVTPDKEITAVTDSTIYTATFTGANFG